MGKYFNKEYNVKQIGGKKALDLYLYGEIDVDGYDWWTGQIIESTTSANYVRKALDEAGVVDEINIYINSIGGLVSEGIAIYNILKRNSAYKTVYIDCYAYSIASVIAMVGDKIVMPSNTTMMIHNAIGKAYGNSKELRKYADDLDTINEASCNSYLVKTKDKIGRDKLNEMLDAETFLTANEAYELGLCDEIIDPVSLDGAVEIIEQAQRSNNPQAKKAMEYLMKNNAKIPSPPQETKITNSLDLFKEICEKRNFI